MCEVNLYKNSPYDLVVVGTIFVIYTFYVVDKILCTIT